MRFLPFSSIFDVDAFSIQTQNSVGVEKMQHLIQHKTAHVNFTQCFYKSEKSHQLLKESRRTREKGEEERKKGRGEKER